MTLNFNDIATKKLEDVERPPLPPMGTYRFKITKLPESSTSGNGEWDIVTFPIRVMEATDDVDVGSYPGDITKVIMSHRFMFNKNDEAEFNKSLDRLKTFLQKHVKCADDNDDIAQALNASVGQEFMATIIWRQDKEDEEIFHANIGKTAPIL